MWFLVAVATASAPVASAITATVATPSASTSTAAATASGTPSLTSTSATISATPTTLSRLGNVHGEWATVHLEVVQRGDGRVGLRLVGHFDEPKATRTAGFPIDDDLGSLDHPVLSKHCDEVVVCCCPGQVADVDVRGHAKTELTIPRVGISQAPSDQSSRY
jgi:hypothetical protein